MFLVASTYLCILLRHSNLLYSQCLLSPLACTTWVIGPTSTAENVTKTYLPVTNIGMLWPAFAGDALAQDHSLSACLLDNLARYVRLASRLVSILLDQAAQCTTYTVYTLPCQGALYKMLKDQEATTVPQTGCEELGELTPYVIQS